MKRECINRGKVIVSGIVIICLIWREQREWSKGICYTTITSGNKLEDSISWK